MIMYYFLLFSFWPRMKVKILSGKLLEWLTFHVWKLTNAQMQKGKYEIYEILNLKIDKNS